MGDLKLDITNLPLDCLKIITSLLDAYDLGNVWLAGNLRLRKMLSEGGGVQKLHYSFDTSYKLLWPRLISSLPRLVEITIEVNIDQYFQEIFDDELSSLPRNLRSLKLKFHRDFTAFNEVYTANPKRFSNLQTLHLLYETRDSLVDLDLSPLSELTSFRAAASNAFRLPFNHLVLPASVTDLQVSLTVSGVENVLPALPTGLQSLSLNLSKRRPIWHLLPRGLLRLAITHPKFFSSTVSLEKLPPQLTSFSARFMTFTGDMALQLPRSVRVLAIQTSKNVRTDLLQKGILPTFSEKMKWISFHFSKMSSDCLQQISRFTELVQLSCRRIDLASLHLLPRSLQILELRYLKTGLNVAHVRQLPPNLTWLSASYEGIETNAWQWLPRGLTSLRMQQTFGEMSVEHAALELPTSLRELKMSYVAASTQFLSNLPNGLTTLMLTTKADLSWASGLVHFPHLQTLNIQAPIIVLKNAKMVLENLPRRLKALTLKVEKTDLKDTDLKLLPTSLTWLDVPSPHITLSSVYNTHPSSLGLPPFLTHFETAVEDDWDEEDEPDSELDTPSHFDFD